MNAIQLDIFTGLSTSAVLSSGHRETPKDSIIIDDVEDFYTSKEFIDCCSRCALRGLCDSDECAQILD